jgi:hypothetical protein
MGLSDQVNDLRAGESSLKAEVAATADRVAAKLADLQSKLTAAGEVDPDLSNDVAELQNDIAQMQQIAKADEPAPTPVEPPVEPSPTEPA